MDNIEYITTKDGKRRMQIVDKVPPRYQIWSVKKNDMPYGYIPFIKLSDNQPFEGSRVLDYDTMIAVKHPAAYDILFLVDKGFKNSEKMKYYLKKGVRCNMNVKRTMERVIPILESLGF